MNRLLPAACLMLGLGTVLTAFAADAVPASAKLSCTVSGFYADGSRIPGSGSEELSIDVRRVNINEKEPSKPIIWGTANDIRVTSNGRIHEARLLRRSPDNYVFIVTSDALIDGSPQTLALIYELRLDRLRLKRTMMTLLSDRAVTLAAEGGCVRLLPAANAATTAPPTEAPTPDWVVELRRKLKECRAKDPLSEASCVERMQGRFCANRTVKVSECEGK